MLNMKHKVVRRIVERCRTEGKRAGEIANELKRAGYQVFIASFCVCEDVVFFEVPAGLVIRFLP